MSGEEIVADVERRMGGKIAPAERAAWVEVLDEIIVERTAVVPVTSLRQAAEWLRYLARDFGHGLNIPTGERMRALADDFDAACERPSARR